MQHSALPVQHRTLRVSRSRCIPESSFLAALGHRPGSGLWPGGLPGFCCCIAHAVFGGSGRCFGLLRPKSRICPPTSFRLAATYVRNFPELLTVWHYGVFPAGSRGFSPYNSPSATEVFAVLIFTRLRWLNRPRWMAYYSRCIVFRGFLNV
jgi:hypothetical protein